MTVPQISIIIPTYNRRELLVSVLQDLEKQSLPADQIEVIVVDDGSKDDTAEVEKMTWAFPLRYVRQNNQGAAAARNNGALLAAGTILFFLDDDIHVNNEYLSLITQEYSYLDRAIIIGTLQPYVRPGRSPFQEIYGRETAALPREKNKQTEELTFVDCLSGMFCVRRDHFFEIGMFQDLAGDGRVAWGDVDFGARANHMGFQFLRCCPAVGYHDDASINDLNSYARRWRRAAEDAVKLFTVYPETVSSLPMFTDKLPIQWNTDNPGLIFRKIFRKVSSGQAFLSGLEHLTAFIEKLKPPQSVLASLYRWVVGGYIFQGYRSGLVKYGSTTSRSR